MSNKKEQLQSLNTINQTTLTIKETAQLLNISEFRVRSLVRENRLETELVPVKEDSKVTKHMISVESIRNYVENKSTRNNSRVFYLVRLSDEELSMVYNFVKENGLDVEFTKRFTKKDEE
jgi:predicted RNA-binding protein